MIHNGSYFTLNFHALLDSKQHISNICGNSFPSSVVLRVIDWICLRILFFVLKACHIFPFLLRLKPKLCSSLLCFDSVSSSYTWSILPLLILHQHTGDFAVLWGLVYVSASGFLCMWNVFSPLCLADIVSSFKVHLTCHLIRETSW